MDEGIQDDLRIGGGFKPETRCGKLRYQFVCIVDFSVVADGIFPALMETDHGLAAPFDITDTQSCMGQTQMGAKVGAKMVTSPVGKGFVHLC